jgi:phosphoglycerate dehydrogenase-like enzyme
VDERALLHALESEKIAGAAVDVLEDEPRVSMRVTDYARCYKNLIITPHIGGNTAESRKKTQLFIAQKIVDFIGGK